MKNSKPKRMTDEFEGWDFAWNVDVAGVLDDTPPQLDGPASLINPIDEDMHADEPVVFGPDGSGEFADAGIQPYGGAD